MRTVILVFIFLLAPGSALAQRVVVLPAAFVVAESGLESAHISRQVTERVEAGVRDAEWEPVDPTAVKKAVEQVAGPGGKCRDRVCLAEVAQIVGADEAVFVQVTELGEMDRDVAVILAYGEGASEKREDGFMVILENIRRLVALALEKSIAARTAAPPEPEPEPKPEPEYEPIKSEPGLEDEDKGLSPFGFYVSAGITSAVTVTWVIIESVGYSKMEDRDNLSDEEVDDLKPLQAVDRVFLGLAAAGLVTTTVFFALTDFDKGKEDTPAAEDTATFSVAPAVSDSAGMLLIEGRF